MGQERDHVLLNGYRNLMNSGLEKTNWKAVLLFYFIACLWSWPFFWWRDINPESWKALTLPRYLKSWLIMWGPGISASICLFIFKNHRRTITFKGTSLWRGILFYYLIPLSFAIWNSEPKFLLIGLLGFISILGEELGWRGFLQDALKIKSDLYKAMLIGFMWEIWHFTNRTASKEPLQAAKLVAMWIIFTSAISYTAIKLTNRTQSLLVAVTIHTAVNAAFEFDNGWQALLTCLPFWVVLIWKWPRQPEQTQQ